LKGLVVKKFRDLKIGDTFDFIGNCQFTSFYETCIKISPRKYAWFCDYWGKRFKSQVGTINVEVFHVNENSINERINNKACCH